MPHSMPFGLMRGMEGELNRCVFITGLRLLPYSFLEGYLFVYGIYFFRVFSIRFWRMDAGVQYLKKGSQE